jgi:hypothetical protein
VKTERFETGADITRSVIRFNAHVLGLVSGLIAAAGLLVATLMMVWGRGENRGEMLGKLHYFFPGYSLSVEGAFVGALWAGGVFYVVGASFARVYGPWFVRHAALGSDATEGGGDPGNGVALLPTLPLALTTGALLSVGLFIATNWLWLRYRVPSPLLELLGQYLPGYTSDFSGSSIGAFWIFLYGCFGGGSVAWIYNRVVAQRMQRRTPRPSRA